VTFDPKTAVVRFRVHNIEASVAGISYSPSMVDSSMQFDTKIAVVIRTDLEA
jgi:hypothetical protein